MSRSAWKGPYIDSKLFEEFLKKPQKKGFQNSISEFVNIALFYR